MKPLWTTGRLRPPVRVQALRLLLIAQTAAVIWLWQWAWRGIQAYAWPGIEMGLTDRGLSYLLVLAPAVPVNLLAVIWLGRGGRRAQLYLSAAFALTIAQLILLLIPVDPGGSTAAGFQFARLVVPIAFAGAAVAVTSASRTWLQSEAEPRRTDIIGVESLAWALTAIVALGAANSVDRWATEAAQAGEPEGALTETEVWQLLEDAVADTTESIPGFAGVEARTVEVNACGYRTEAGYLTYRYRLAYALKDADLDRYAEAIETHWAEADYELTYNGETLEGDRWITATHPEDLTLTFAAAETPTLALQGPCVERTEDHPECIPPQGNVPGTNDEVKGLTCPGKD